MNKLKGILLLTAVLLSVNLYSAKKVKLPKFGKFNKEIFNGDICPMDSNAHAYYIFNVGIDEIEYVSGKGFNLMCERHFMIKFLDDQELSRADIAVPYFVSSSGREIVSNIKACAYNMVDGKVVKSALSKKDISTEETTENWFQKKFNVPDVKKGTIIEVKYTVSTPFFENLDSWEIQKTIPVQFSYYNVGIPEYFIYHHQQKGYLPFNFTKSTENGAIGTESYLINTYTIIKDSVPAFKAEKHLRTKKNFISSINFELSHIDIPGMVRKEYSTSWSKVGKTLMDAESVGHRLKYDGFLKEMSASLTEQYPDPEERLKAALSAVQKHFTFNKRASIYTSGTLSSSFNKKEGNSADINYTLVALLRRTGINAFPMLISTTDRGMIMKATPSIGNFNFAIAGAVINGKVHYMDATSDFSEVDLLPYSRLNYEGAALIKDNFQWLNMRTAKSYDTRKVYMLTLNEDGSLNGQVRFTDKDYAAYSRRLAVHKSTSVDEYMEKMESKYEGLKIVSHKFDNLDSSYCEINCNMEVEVENAVQNAGDLILFNPLLFHAHEENPFKLEKREYPVEFSSPLKEQVNVQVTIPDGYEVEEMPKPIQIALPDKSAYFIYSANKMGNKVVVNSQLIRKKSQYLPTAYPYLKELYKQVVAKEGANIVLKKSEVANN